MRRVLQRAVAAIARSRVVAWITKRVRQFLDAPLLWVAHRGAAFAIIFGAPWAIYQFYYKEIWEPGHRAPSVNVEASLEPEEARGGLVPVQCRITVENPSDRDANVFASWYMLAGVVLQRDTLTDPEWRNRIAASLKFNAPSNDRSVYSKEQKVMSAGLLAQFMRTLGARERSTINFLSFVPADSFDELRLHANVVTQVRDRGLSPGLKMTGGGWLEMEPTAMSGSDTVWVPDSDRRLMESGFVLSFGHAEHTLPGRLLPMRPSQPR